MHYNCDSNSYKNIDAAFHDESADHVRYMILAKNARTEGNEGLAAIYDKLADEEFAHAETWHNELNRYDEKSALDARITAEKNDKMYVYPQYAAAAEKDGYEALADKFLANGNAEGGHADILENYRQEQGNGTLHHCNEAVVWRCHICGHSHTGTEAPKECPLCGYGRNAYTRMGL